MRKGGSLSLGESLILKLPKTYVNIWRARQHVDPVAVVSETAYKIEFKIDKSELTRLRAAALVDSTASAHAGLDSKAAAHLRTSAQTLLSALDPSPKQSRSRTGKRMTGAELQARREFLGLTQAGLAEILGVQTKSVEIWELGSNPVPYDMAARLKPVEAFTRATIAVVVKQINERTQITLYRKEADFQTHQLPKLKTESAFASSAIGARWWRQLAIRAVEEFRRQDADSVVPVEIVEFSAA